MAHDVLLFSLSGSRASCARELDLCASFPPRSSSSRAAPRGRTSPRRRKRTRAAEATAAGKQTHDENEDRTRTPRHIRTQTSLLSFCVQPGGRAIFWFVCCDGYIFRRPGGRSLRLVGLVEECLARSLDLLRAPAVSPSALESSIPRASPSRERRGPQQTNPHARSDVEAAERPCSRADRSRDAVVGLHFIASSF